MVGHEVTLNKVTVTRSDSIIRFFQFTQCLHFRASMRRKLAVEYDADLMATVLHIRVTKEEIFNLFRGDNVHCSSDVTTFVFVVEAAVDNVVAVIQVSISMAIDKGSKLVTEQDEKNRIKDANLRPNIRSY